MDCCRIRFALTIVVAMVLTAPAHSRNEMTTSPIADGMIINTRDKVLQQVEVRVKSFGPGFCQVSVTFADEPHSFSAPPLSWSDWFKLAPAVNGGSYRLGFEPGCDTGAIGEIRYLK